MKEKIFLWLGLLIASVLSAQIKGIVLDEFGKPIPYVNIWVENETIGTTSEIDGTYSLNIKEEKVLVFSALGFEAKKISSKNEAAIVLKPIAYELKEVVINTSKKEITKLIGDSKKSASSYISGRSPWIYAKLFKYEISYEKTPFIKNAIIYTNSKIKNACFKLRIYKIKDDGLPGEDLINENIVVYVEKGMKKSIVDLSKYNLNIPSEGLFIAFEWMLIENNKSERDYEPALVCNYKDRDLTVTYANGIWNKRPKIDFELNKNIKGTVIEPAINLTLTN